MKKLILMRSISGGGKSTLARKIKEENSKKEIYTEILSADDFWGEDYKFVISKLGKAHEWNKKRCLKAMKSGVECIIIDNTNTVWKECKPYVEMAKEHGYEVEQAIPKRPSVQECINRNVHNVPADVIINQASRFHSPESIDKKIAATLRGLAPPIQYKNHSLIFFENIVSFHGVDWAEEWNKAAGCNTGMVTEDGRLGIYYDDYKRFANVVDFGIPTFFD